VVTQTYPALHGLYRALISTQFRWTISDWLSLSNVISDLLEEDVIDRLNSLVTDIVQLNDVDAHLPQTVLSRYIHKDRPFSGYFAVCCVMEIQWTVLAQTLIPWDEKSSKSKFIDKIEDAAAANAAWAILVSKKVAIQDQYSQAALEGLKRTRDRAMECFTDLLAQMGEIEGEPSMDTYAWETMAECLVSLNQFVNCLSSKSYFYSRKLPQFARLHCRTWIVPYILGSSYFSVTHRRYMILSYKKQLWKPPQCYYASEVFFI
jgi:phosphatidylinositol 4-kinase A